MTENQPIDEKGYEPEEENTDAVNIPMPEESDGAVNEEDDEAAIAENEEEQGADEAWREAVFSNDLKSIKEVFPFVEASHISQLGEEFLTLMSLGSKHGISAVDAFAATHREQVAQNMEKKARQQALTKLESKAHMKPMLGVGANTTEVPRAVYEKYKRLIPGITDSEIRRHYNKSKED